MKNHLLFITSDNYRIMDGTMTGYFIYKGTLYRNNFPGYLSEIEDGQGAFVLVKKQDKEIKLLRDAMGLIRLYCFKKNDYWAISNSFWYLCEEVKKRFSLTLNRGFAELLFTFDMTPYAAGQSLCNEVMVLSSFAEIRIDYETGQLHINDDYKLKNKVSIDSPEGMEIVDDWISRWGTIVKAIENSGIHLRFDLSGGYDSRITYAIARNANVNFTNTNVKVYSTQPQNMGEGAERHFSGDLEIAEKIAQCTDVKIVSNPNCFHGREISAERRYEIYKHTLSDCVIQAFDRRYYHKEPLILLGGYLGETIRGYGEHYGINSLIRQSCVMSQEFSRNLIMAHGIKSTLDGYQRVKDLTGNQCSDSLENSDQYCIECLDGAFFGKQIQQYSYMNILCMSPYMDIALRKLCYPDGIMPKLVLIVILLRTCPELLEIPFSSENSFTDEEIQYAKYLCEKYEKNIHVEETVVMKFSGEIDEMDEHLYTGKTATLEEVIIKKFNEPKIAKNIEDKFGSLGKRMWETAEEHLTSRMFHPETYASGLCAISDMIDIEKESAGIMHAETDTLRIWEYLAEEYSEIQLLNTLKNQYEDANRMWNFLDKAEKFKNYEIYLYGAGKYAVELAEKLKKKDIYISGFIVSELQNGKKELMDRPVFDAKEFIYKRNKMIVLPAVSSIFYEEVVEMIKEL